MPIAELESYTGTNPCPADHAAYWDRALAEMNALDPATRIEPASFETPFADCFDLTYTGVGGARIHAKLLVPKTIPEPAPAVLHFHGYSCRAADWTGLLMFAAAGFVTAAIDVRGQGGESTDPGGHRGWTLRGQFVRGLEDHEDRLFFRDVYLDCAQLAKIVGGLDSVYSRRLATWGASQGGALSLACAALAPIRRCVTLYPFLSDFQRVWDMDLCRSAYDELREFFRWRDPNHERHDHWFHQLGYIDVQHLAPRIEADVLMGTGLADAVCPPSTQYAAYNRITSDKRQVLFHDYGHENLNGFDDTAYAYLLELL